MEKCPQIADIFVNCPQQWQQTHIILTHYQINVIKVAGFGRL